MTIPSSPPLPASEASDPARALGRPLTDFREGDSGRLAPSELDPKDRALLDALGLGERCRFRVSKAGDPWILQVRGTRIGLATAIACRLLVIPEPQ